MQEDLKNKLGTDLEYLLDEDNEYWDKAILLGDLIQNGLLDNDLLQPSKYLFSVATFPEEDYDDEQVTIELKGLGSDIVKIVLSESWVWHFHSEEALLNQLYDLRLKVFTILFWVLN